MRTTQREFHSMRGHVVDGCEVVCESGAVVTLRSAIRGWDIVDTDGRVIQSVGPDAMAVTRAILDCP